MATRFVFSSADVDTGKKISVSSENQSINAVIEQILRGQGLTYEIQGKNIILKKVNVSDQQVPKKNITGSVLDVNGDAIIGANIVVKGTTMVRLRISMVTSPFLTYRPMRYSSYLI